MWRALLWVPVMLLMGSEPAGGRAAGPQGRQTDPSPSLQEVLEVEAVARLLAILLDSGRAVINENQNFFDKPTRGENTFSTELFERQVADVFRSRSGIDLQDLGATKVPVKAKDLLTHLMKVSKHVVEAAQQNLDRRSGSSPGFVPAVFGARVAAQFSNATGVRLKQTALSPRNPANAPDGFEQAALQEFSDPDYPREKSISEVTTESKALRLMFPLYLTRQCLDCHGEPKGDRDRTGFQKEGLQLGQNAGAISVIIPVHK